MDIKSRKWKSIVSAAAFFSGISLILGNLLGAVGTLGRHGYYTDDPEELLAGDYQETAEFRSIISQRLETFLAMSVNGPFGYYYGSYENPEDPAESVAGSSAGEVAQKAGEDYAEASAEEKAAGGTWQQAAEDYGYDYTAWANEYGYSRNYVRNGGNTVYHDNGYYYGNDGYWEDGYWDENIRWPSEEQNKKAAERIHKSMEKNKNLLYSISNNGKLLYTNGAEAGLPEQLDPDASGDWAAKLPEGYNFLLYYEDGKVSILKDGKLLDVYGDGYYREESGWYVPGYRNFPASEDYAGVRICIAAAGVLYSGNYQERLYMLDGLLFSGNWDYYGNAVETAAELGRQVLIGLNPAGVTLLFWVIWLFVNDLRKNRKEWKHGICYKIYYLTCVKDMEGRLAKKIVRRGNMLTAVCAGQTAAAGCLLLIVIVWTEGFGGNLLLLLAVALPLCLPLAVQYYFQKKQKAIAADLDLLAGRVEEIRGGNYQGGGAQPADSDFQGIFTGLEDIRRGMAEAVDEQMKSERMKVELIANVSHDVKTPLTSIISYVELLKQEKDLPEHVKDYIHILDDKSIRLKNMVQDVFVVSKAASGELPVNMEILDFGKLLRQTLADMDEQIRSSSLVFKAEIPEEPVLIRADGQRLYRVFQNLFQNAMKYSLEGSRVYITLKKDASMAVAGVKNTSRSELNQGTDFTERFLRGDESRTDGGSGLGLSIARSFTEACGGSFRLETIADLFAVTVSFRAEEPGAHGAPGTHGMSDAHGAPDTQGMSGAHGMSDTQGMSGAHGMSDTQGTSGAQGAPDI